MVLAVGGPGGEYTVTAINGQTITATAAGMSFTVVSSDGGMGAAGGMSGGFAGGGPGAIGVPGPANTVPLTVTIAVSATTVYTRAEHPASLSDVQVGSVLHVEGTCTGAATINASSVEIVLPQRIGVVTAVSGNTLTMTGLDARTYSIVTDGDTVYQRAGQTAALSDIAVGSLIAAEGTPSSNGSTLDALAVTIQLPRVAGQVTAISGDTLTVKGPDDTSATVLLTAATQYSAGPQSSAGRSSITTGSFIMAEGTVGSDGSLTALQVDIATAKSGTGSLSGPSAVPGSNAGGSAGLPA
jgi:hypothetical protein